MLTVYVPPGEGGYFEENKIQNGKGTTTKYAPRLHNGRLVVDVPAMFFRKTILGGPQGLLWERSNPEAMEWLGRNPDGMINNAFPGANRAAPAAQVVTVSTPAIFKLVAPEGASSYSYAGVESKIGRDRTVTVDAHVADVLRSHGYVDVA
jgi:hypothetical protein